MSPLQFIELYKAALATQSWQNIAPLISDDAVVHFSNGQVHSGIAAIQQAFEYNFSLIKNEDYQMNNVRYIELSENSARVSFDYCWSGFIHGEAVSGEGFGTIDIEKSGEQWSLVKEKLEKR